MYTGLQVKFPLYLSDFNEIGQLRLLFSTDLRNTQVLNFTKIRPLGAWRFYASGLAGGHRRHDQDNSRFSQFCERA